MHRSAISVFSFPSAFSLSKTVVVCLHVTTHLACVNCCTVCLVLCFPPGVAPDPPTGRVVPPARLVLSRMHPSRYCARHVASRHLCPGGMLNSAPGTSTWKISLNSWPSFLFKSCWKIEAAHSPGGGKQIQAGSRYGRFSSQFTTVLCSSTQLICRASDCLHADACVRVCVL